MSGPNQYADEGSIAHVLAAMCLREGKPAAAYEGRVLRCQDYEHARLSPSRAPQWMRCVGSHAMQQPMRIAFKPRTFTLQVSKEMAIGVQVYLDNIMRLARGNEVHVEQAVPIDSMTGEEGATGTADAIVLDAAAFEIQVHDLKFGQGVEVSAERNEQLMMYGVGAYEKFGHLGDFENFRLFIHQPRIREEPSEFTISLQDLLAFRDECRVKAYEATAIWDSVKDHGKILDHAKVWAEEGDILVPGDKQCRQYFCDARAQCPAAQQKVTEIATAEFEDLTVKPSVQALTEIPADNEKLARLVQWTPFLRAWCDAVDAHAESEILAGRPVPGLKAVEGKKGNRAWKDETEAEKQMKSMRMKHDEMYSYKVISPTQAERLVKAGTLGERQWKKLQALITQAPGKPTVVPLTDKRPPLQLAAPKDEFEDQRNPEELV